MGKRPHMTDHRDPEKGAMLFQLSSAIVFALTVLGAALGIAERAKAGPVPPFQTDLDRDNPLVGRIHDARSGAWVDPAAVLAAARTARFVLVGETHDNPDHHAIQAWIVRELIADGATPAVAFEQITEDKQAVIDDVLQPGDGDVSALGKALDWENSGWPAWPHYGQIASPAVAAGLPVIAANLPREKLRAVYGDPASAFDAERLARLKLQEDLPETVRDAILDDVDDGHCGLMERSMLTPMISVQSARDAVMADNLMRGAEMSGSAVLITGNGHVQADRAVPFHLRRRGADGIVTIGLYQVAPEKTALADYLTEGVDGVRPFDFIWFTPRVSDRDHCAELAAHMNHGKKDDGGTTQ